MNAILALIYIVGIIVSYKFVISKWENPMFEKVWFSIVWVCLIPLYIIHVINDYYAHRKK